MVSSAMVIENLPLVRFLVILLLLLLLFQGFLFAMLLLNLKRRSADFNRIFDLLTGQLLEAMEGSRNCFRWLDSIGEKLPGIERGLTRFLSATSGILQSGGRKAASGLEVARESIRAASRQFEGTLNQFTRKTSKVQRLARTPALHVSALLHGGLAALREFLKERKAENPARHVSDKEIFI